MSDFGIKQEFKESCEPENSFTEIIVKQEEVGDSDDEVPEKDPLQGK
jgi:hypothetical protein